MNNITNAYFMFWYVLYCAGPKGITFNALRQKLSDRLGYTVYQACFGNESGTAGGNSNHLEEVLAANLAEGTLQRVSNKLSITPKGILELTKLTCEYLGGAPALAKQAKVVLRNGTKLPSKHASKTMALVLIYLALIYLMNNKMEIEAQKH